MRTSEVLGVWDMSAITKFVEDFVGFNELRCAKQDIVDIIEYGEWNGRVLVYVPNQKRACYKAEGEENGYWFDADSLEDANSLVVNNTYIN